jgi:hypothetical protein
LDETQSLPGPTKMSTSGEIRGHHVTERDPTGSDNVVRARRVPAVRIVTA